MIGGFCPLGFRKVDADYPDLWVYTDTLEEFRVKEPERKAFAQALRTALGDHGRFTDFVQPYGPNPISRWTTVTMSPA